MSKRNSISAIFIIFILIGCGGGSATVTQEVNNKQLHSDLNFNGVTYTKQDFKTEFTGLYLNKNTSLSANHLETAIRVLKNIESTISNKISITDLSILISPDKDSAVRKSLFDTAINENGLINIEESMIKSLTDNEDTKLFELIFIYEILKNKNGQPLNTLDSGQVIKFLSIANALIEMQYGSKLFVDNTIISEQVFQDFLNNINEPYIPDTVWFSLDNKSFNGINIVETAINNYINDNPAAKLHNIWQIPTNELLKWYLTPIRNKKSNPYVRTPNIDEFNQVPDEEFSRQAKLFPKLYFLEGLHHEKQIALTFDDGPSQYSSGVLEVLEKNNIKATFFVTGNNIAANKSVLKNISDKGHTISHHSWSHPDTSLFENNDRWWQQEFKPTNDLLYEAIGYRAAIFRPPFGRIRDDQINYLSQKGILVVNWSIDTRDWNPNTNTVENIENAVITNQHPEAIVLMHDGGGDRSNTVAALNHIIQYYKELGFEFVTVDKLLGINKAY
ncbi:polysaccharide deacetylase family protein [Pseudoalteromonas sp. C2R02]|uniref:polysaccharide deacetylase family protein n=1 Tax=Pseudoalteromonas sp. C2R02 TaxID=2841565 RepID=UPI001C089A0E|nr:polysaccharide deacetylase family protein [Pseudoalteromonas sp. C2R02]MBU2970713.1 polysaccharide deacetylase family protein [Pseudoalteromonas sp. C2R02]